LRTARRVPALTADCPTPKKTNQGNDCFRITFLSLAALATCGACLAGFLATLLADFYAQVVSARSAVEPGGYFAALGLSHGAKDASSVAL
jgi:hypothetical protein